VITWYAVYTRPQAEARALENLLRQGYSAYLPRYRTEIRHARHRQTVSRPLFPRYLFAGIDRPMMRWRPILSTFGVVGIVRAGEHPNPVASQIIDALRGREAAGEFDRLGRCAPLCLGELVRVTAGALQDMFGLLAELRDQDRVVVLLEILGRTVPAQLDIEAVEAA